MRLWWIWGPCLITMFLLCGMEADAMAELGKENESNQPEVGDGWMLHTPGGGPLDSRCPCLASNICPRAFGRSPTDMLLLGHLPVCHDESKVRCCGASLSFAMESKSFAKTSTVENKDSMGSVNVAGDSIHNTQGDNPVDERNLPENDKPVINSINGSGIIDGENGKLHETSDASMESEEAETAVYVHEASLFDSGNNPSSQPNNSSTDPPPDTDLHLDSAETTSHVDLINETLDRSNDTLNIVEAFEEIESAENVDKGDLNVTTTEPNDISTGLSAETIHPLGSNEMDDHVYIEGFKPEVLMLQDKDDMGIIHDSKGGSVMVVTPIPLTPRAKYQQQVAARANDDLKINDSLPNFHVQKVMHITHRPMGEVAIVTPLPTDWEEPTTESTSPSTSLVNDESLHPPIDTKDLETEYEFEPLKLKKNIIPSDLLSENNAPMLENEMWTAEIREKRLTSPDFPIEEEDTSMMPRTTAEVKETTTVEEEEITMMMDQKDQMKMDQMDDGSPTSETPPKSLNSTNTQAKPKVEVKVRQPAQRNPRRPLRSRATPRPRWSPKRTRTRKPAVLQSPGDSPQQASTLKGRKNFENNTNGQETRAREAAASSTVVVTKKNPDSNPIQQNFMNIPQTIKYVPMTIDEIEHKLQPREVPVRQSSTPNILVPQQNTHISRKDDAVQTMVHQQIKFNSSPSHTVVNLRDQEGKKHGEDIVIRKQVELDFIHHELSSLYKNLKEWLKQNSDGEPNDGQGIDTRIQKTGKSNALATSSKKFQPQIEGDHLDSIVFQDSVFGRRLPSSKPHFNSQSIG